MLIRIYILHICSRNTVLDGNRSTIVPDYSFQHTKYECMLPGGSMVNLPSKLKPLIQRIIETLPKQITLQGLIV